MPKRSLPAPPVALRRPYTFTRHGVSVDDPYHWLRDPGYPEVSDPEVLAYLEAENRYFEAFMAPLEAATQALFEEIKARQKLDDASVPFRERGFFYQWSYARDAQYPVWYRWPAALSDAPPAAARTVILDEPAMAEGHDYFRLGAWSVSASGRYLAYTVDTTGAERFELRIRDLETGAHLPETIADVLGTPVWANDDATLFYTRVNEQWRTDKAFRHRLGTDPAEDVLVFQEHDERFSIGVGKTTSDSHIVISTGDHVTDERHLLPADAPEAALALVSERRTGREYDIDHQGDRFVILTNDTHKNFRIAVAPQHDPSEAAWTTLVEGSDAHYLRGIHCTKDHIVVAERIDGLDQIRLVDRDGRSRYVEFPEAAYSAGLGTNAEFDVDTLRLGYSSMVTPGTVFDYAIATGSLTTRKVQEIPSGYDASRYRSERLHAAARDGATVPVSLVYRADTPLDGSAPLFLYAYGAYGYAVPPSFSTTRISLLDRGFVYAIAHIRGGDDLGYHWYEDGKLEKRTNTFNDFVDVARFLVAEGWVQAGRIATAGGSAGGELMGAVVNQAPELWGAVVAHVPFVDVLNTMLDASLPLTPGEWSEWGNPVEDPAAFELIRSYSPYDQLRAGAYPPMLVTAGLNDPRVTYWEPAKYVAKLRTLKTDDHPLLLKTNMGAGHGGKSGRFDSLYEVAEEYAFVIDALTTD